MNKEISDSLHFLLHCSLNDARFETQREQFEFIYKYIENLVKENQELKLELSGYRQAILKDKEMLGLKEENDKLKKQLEELEEENFNLRENIYIEKMSFSNEGRNIKELIEMPTYEDLLNQQKEFIEYLENEKDRLARICNNLGEDKFDEADDILQKYKEIIGDDK